jgi:hypothetical protein
MLLASKGFECFDVYKAFRECLDRVKILYNVNNMVVSHGIKVISVSWFVE